MRLNELSPPWGAHHRKKRLGRGESSGLGKTSGRGHKGQKARAGGFHKRGFEGGQMPLARRLPKRGFFPLFKKEYLVVNVADLSSFSANAVIDKKVLDEAGLIRKSSLPLKILGDGDLSVALQVKADRFSKSARTKIEKAGGQVILNG